MPDGHPCPPQQEGSWSDSGCDLRLDHSLRSSLFDLTACALLLVERSTGQILESNRAATDQLGYSREELLQFRNTVLSTEPQATAEATREAVRLLPLCWLRRRDGSGSPVEIRSRCFRLEGHDVLLWELRDLTQGSPDAHHLLRAEARLQALMRIVEHRAANVHDFLDHALDEVLAITSSRIGYIYHYDEDSREFILNSWSRSVMASCAIARRQTRYALDETGFWGEVVRQRRPMVLNDFTAKNSLRKGHPPGHAPLTNFLSIPVFVDNRIVAVVGVANKASDYTAADVSEVRLLMDKVWAIVLRMRAEETLHLTEERLLQMIKRLPVPLMVVDATGKPALVNDRFTSTYGYQLTDLPTIAAFWDLVHTDDAARMRAKEDWDGTVRRALLTSTNIEPTEQKIVCQDRTERDIEISGVALGGSVLMLLLDRTDAKRADAQRRSMESQLLLAKKLESVGRLAAGVAHEINTPTQYVSDNTRFLSDSITGLLKVCAATKQLRQLAAGVPELTGVTSELASLESEVELDFLLGEIPRTLAESNEGLQRIAKIVRSLKDFSHPGNTERTPLDISRAIETTVAVSRHEWKYVAEVVTVLDPDLPKVPCIADEFHQVLLNLVVNAAQAIAAALPVRGEKLGRITIRTRSEPGWAVIEVEDTGTGIPPEAQSHIFEPFFTTKAVGEGTGQGLAIVHAVVVKKHGGRVDFTTSFGHGTTFRIALPLDTVDPRIAAEVPVRPV